MKTSKAVEDGRTSRSFCSRRSSRQKSVLFCWLAGSFLLLLTPLAIAETASKMLERPTAALHTGRPRLVQAKPRVSWFRRHFGKVSWDEAVMASESPSDVCSFVAGRIRYVREDVDKWSTPRETWKTGRGDCEEFAVCVVEMCKQLGIPAWVQLYFPPNGREGHAIAIGFWRGEMWMSSLGRYERVEDDNEVKEIVASVLWCHKDELWNARLDEGAVARRIAKHQVQRLN